jgi:hypothetical protein
MAKELTAQRMGEIALLMITATFTKEVQEEIFDNKPENVDGEITDMSETLGIKKGEVATFMTSIVQVAHEKRKAQREHTHAEIIYELSRIANK